MSDIEKLLQELIEFLPQMSFINSIWGNNDDLPENLSFKDLQLVESILLEKNYKNLTDPLFNTPKPIFIFISDIHGINMFPNTKGSTIAYFTDKIPIIPGEYIWGSALNRDVYQTLFLYGNKIDKYTCVSLRSTLHQTKEEDGNKTNDVQS